MNLTLLRKRLFSFLFHPIKYIKLTKQIGKWAREDRNNPKAPVISDTELWKKRSKAVITASLRHRENSTMLLQVIYSFYNSRITALRGLDGSIPEESIILITAVKNEKSRISHFLKHYRSIGVKHFVFIDNASNDGTVETILEQHDTACYKTDCDFDACAKAGWFNRLAAHFGTNRWYIIVDSDEHFVYPDMKLLNIEQYAEKAQKNGLSCIKTVMLDVYPDGILMDENKTDEEYLDSCIYYDRGDEPYNPGGYTIDAINNVISGGMRARLFHNETGANLTKPALLHYKSVYFVNTHDVFPVPIDKTSPFGGALLHYKFLPSDRLKYKQRALEGRYYNNSMMYKEINDKMEQTPGINAVSEISVMFSIDDFTEYLPFINNLTR